MRKVLRVLGYGLAGLAGLALLAAAAGWWYGGRIMARTYDVPGALAAPPADDGTVAEGERLSRIAGCTDGCHGDGVGGADFFDSRWLGTIRSPDLTRVAATHTDAEMERAIRHGVRKDGTSLLVMPSEMFAPMTDAHLGAILAYVRSLPRGQGPPEAFVDLRLGRLLLAADVFDPAAQRVSLEAWAHEPGPDDPLDWGHYLAMTSCTECHGQNLEGSSDGSTPNLSIAGAYSLDQFRTLMDTGVPMDGRELDLMALVAQKRFSHFTDAEVAALHAYLVDRAGVARPPGPSP